MLVVSGCTSEDPNSVGSSLQQLDFDTVLAPVKADSALGFAALDIQDPDVPVNNQQVLYLGSQQGTSSSILVNFNFDDLVSEDFPESLFTDANIKTVKLSLTRLRYYGTASTGTVGDGSTRVPNIKLSFQMLEAPFDTTGYPGPVPPLHSSLELIKPLDNGEEYDGHATEPQVNLFKADFLAWMAAGGTRGFLISAAQGSDSTLVGFASRELNLYGELADVAVGTVVAPNLIVEFNDQAVSFLLPPVADVSTFDHIAPVSTDPDQPIVLRTGLRSCPVFRFDFSQLPPNAFINRAIFAVTNDTTTSFGNLHSIVISELPEDQYQAPVDTLTLSELGAAVYVVTGQTSLSPTLNRDIRFDVTQAVQRMANHVYDGERALVMTAGEDFAPAYDQGTIDPEFYFSQFNFMGFGAPESLRPRLQITYSLAGGLNGEGQ